MQPSTKDRAEHADEMASFLASPVRRVPDTDESAFVFNRFIADDGACHKALLPSPKRTAFLTCERVESETFLTDLPPGLSIRCENAEYARKIGDN